MTSRQAKPSDVAQASQGARRGNRGPEAFTVTVCKRSLLSYYAAPKASLLRTLHARPCALRTSRLPPSPDPGARVQRGHTWASSCASRGLPRRSARRVCACALTSGGGGLRRGFRAAPGCARASWPCGGARLPGERAAVRLRRCGRRALGEDGRGKSRFPPQGLPALPERLRGRSGGGRGGRRAHGPAAAPGPGRRGGAGGEGARR